MPLAKFTMLGRIMDQASPYDWQNTFTLSSGYEKNNLELKMSSSSGISPEFQGLLSGKFLYAEVISAMSTNPIYLTTSAQLSTGVSGDNLSTIMICNNLFKLGIGGGQANWMLVPLGTDLTNKMYWKSWTKGNAFLRLILIGL